MKLAQFTFAYSPLFEVRVLGSLLYILEIAEVIAGRKKILLFFSNEDRKLSRALMSECVKRSNSEITCTTMKLGYVLKLLHIPIVLDLQDENELVTKDEASFQSVMWTMVKVTRLTQRTKKLFQEKYSPQFAKLF